VSDHTFLHAGCLPIISTAAPRATLFVQTLRARQEIRHAGKDLLVGLERAVGARAVPAPFCQVAILQFPGR
jgi:hypothetical protein